MNKYIRVFIIIFVIVFIISALLFWFYYGHNFALDVYQGEGESSTYWYTDDEFTIQGKILVTTLFGLVAGVVLLIPVIIFILLYKITSGRLKKN